MGPLRADRASASRHALCPPCRALAAGLVAARRQDRVDRPHRRCNPGFPSRPVRQAAACRGRRRGEPRERTIVDAGERTRPGLARHRGGAGRRTALELAHRPFDRRFAPCGRPSGSVGRSRSSPTIERYFEARRSGHRHAFTRPSRRACRPEPPKEAPTAKKGRLPAKNT